MPPSAKRRKLSDGDAAPSAASNVTVPPANALTNGSDKNTKDQRRSLFVRSLPASVTTGRLSEHFSQSFPLKHATVVLDKTTGISRGFGFVTFTDAEDARNAVNQLNDSVLDGRKIKVEIAESRNREVDEDVVTGRSKGSVNVKGQELRAERQKQQDANRPPKLIVRNLPWSIKTSEDLAQLFLSYGKVKHAVVPKLALKTKGGAQPQAGFGIVILRGRKNAEKALERVNGKEVDGRVLAVDWAVDRETWEKTKEGQVEDEAEDGVGDELEVSASEVQAADAEEESFDNGLDHEELDSSDEGVHVEEEDGDLEGDEEIDNDADSVESDDGTSTTSHLDSNSNTIFIRNLPFTADDDSLYMHFKTHFGPVRYARVVYDQGTERSRGTGFVSFYSEDVAKTCVKNAPKHDSPSDPPNGNDKKRRGEAMTHSLLQNEMNDPSGTYTLEGRILQISRALPKGEADRRADESSKKRSENKRRLYLLSEGTIPKGSQLYNSLGKAETDIRESSSRQRQKLVKENPNLGLSLTRLSVRNIPRAISSKELKALAREAIVGFAKDMKEGKRQPLSREELTRGGEEDREAERLRKEKGKGIVKQVKIVFESDRTGSKVGEGKGGRSRGYGFIEYYGHRHALMGLRWLNGHLVKAQSGDGSERSKRLIVEFAIENAQVLQRRTEREKKARENGFYRDGKKEAPKRKRENEEEDNPAPQTKQRKGDKENKRAKPEADDAADQDAKNKLAARNRIIAQKRQKRKSRRG